MRDTCEVVERPPTLTWEQLGFQQTQIPSLEQVGTGAGGLLPGKSTIPFKDLGSKMGPQSSEDTG